jgi:hydroxyethylthiazole kinase
MDTHEPLLNTEALWQDIAAIRQKRPLVHNITNYVVMNSTANALLALGASPVMAHGVDEVADMVSLAGMLGGALVINIGTLSKPWIAAMEVAMAAARQHRVPIVFDPVGAGATGFRTDTCKRLLAASPASVIRGNGSEIMALLDDSVQTKGVDAAAGGDPAAAARACAQAYGCVVCASGAVDYISDGATDLHNRSGHPLMARVTGMGCTATAIIGAFAAVNANAFEATAHAMAVMGLAGEKAASQAAGPGSLQLHFYDALYNLNKEQLI